jgi:hypothetical protein
MRHPDREIIRRRKTRDDERMIRKAMMDVFVNVERKRSSKVFYRKGRREVIQ